MEKTPGQISKKINCCHFSTIYFGPIFNHINKCAPKEEVLIRRIKKFKSMK